MGSDDFLFSERKIEYRVGARQNHLKKN
jgi:hypothetical protein